MEPTTLILLALAAFVLWKLRTVLGQRGMGRDTPPFDPLQRRDAPPRDSAADGSNVVPLPGSARPDAPKAPANDGPRWAGIAEPGTPLATGLDAISAADSSFDPRAFIGGARGAYEMIVTAFARGDRKQLSGLLARDVFDGFSSAIAEREKANQSMETTFVSLDDAKITDAGVKDRQAQVTVRFVSKIISATRDAQGNVVDGDPAKIAEVIDVWTFARDVRARDPSWHLIATESDA
ncbi:MAG: Tim44/TimA family putative adaptor protein [Beijerinckiaceae bacterium]